MIEKLKTVLLKIRKEREDELEEYKSYGVDPERYANRKAILTLELPFKTDYASIVKARASAYQKLDEERNRRLGIDCDLFGAQGERMVSLHENQSAVTEQKHIVVKRRIKEPSKNAYTFLEEWIRSAKGATVHARRTLYYVLKNWIANFYATHPRYDKVMISSPSLLSAEDLPYVLTMEAMETVINGLDVDSTTKEVYLSYARSLRDFIMKAYPISPILFARRSPLSICNAAKLFEYLEKRALNTTTIDRFHDILICRALFYAPLPTKEFFSMGPPDENSSCLRWDDNVFCIPSSFIRLWKELCCRERLFIRTFDDRQLHKKIKRLGQYAELSIESLTPSVLRASKTAFLGHLSLSTDVVEFLPKRI